MMEKEAKGRRENWGKGGTGRTEKEKGRRGQDEEKRGGGEAEGVRIGTGIGMGTCVPMSKKDLVTRRKV